MKYNVTVTYESESLEKDIDTLVGTLMSAYERFKRIEKETEPEKVEVPDSLFDEMKADIKGLDNRIDGLEAEFDSFCEVEKQSKKTSK